MRTRVTFRSVLHESPRHPCRTQRWWIDVPAAARAALGGAPRVEGTVNGAPFGRPVQAVVREEPVDGEPERWRVWFGRWWVEASGLQTGDAVEVEVWPAPDGPRPGPWDVASRASRVRSAAATWRAGG